jgi:hypothetical protein
MILFPHLAALRQGLSGAVILAWSAMAEATQRTSIGNGRPANGGASGHVSSSSEHKKYCLSDDSATLLGGPRRGKIYLFEPSPPKTQIPQLLSGSGPAGTPEMRED